MTVTTPPSTVTMVPAPRVGGNTAVPVRRRVRSFNGDDWLSLVGSVAASLALVTIGYEHLLDLSGTLGFTVCWYAVFIGLYAIAVGMSHPRPIVVERVVTATLWAAAGILVFTVGSVLVYTFYKGFHAFAHLNFFTRTSAGQQATAPLTVGGALQAIVGTLVEVGIAMGFSLPIGIATAVYLSEVGGPLSRLVRTMVEAMTALPEVLAALFIYVALIVGLGVDKSGIAASAAMAVTMVPIIARASEVALRVVSGGLREASFALGATRWRTVRKIVLPTARAGLATSAILGVARGIGETAVPLICSGVNTFMKVNPIGAPMNSLPLYIYSAYVSGQPLQQTRAFGAASVLLMMVALLFVAARILTRSKALPR